MSAADFIPAPQDRGIVRTRVTFVEFREGRPHEVCVEHTHADGRLSFTSYDADWCKRDGHMLYSDSGGGDGAESWPHVVHRHPYWAAPDVVVRRYVAQGKTRPGGPKPERYPALPEAWSEERLLEDIAAHETDKILVCHDCDDAFDERELCQHCWFCDVTGWWSTPGDPCGHRRGSCDAEDYAPALSLDAFVDDHAIELDGTTLRLGGHDFVLPTERPAFQAARRRRKDAECFRVPDEPVYRTVVVLLDVASILAEAQAARTAEGRAMAAAQLVGEHIEHGEALLADLRAIDHDLRRFLGEERYALFAHHVDA